MRPTPGFAAMSGEETAITWCGQFEVYTTRKQAEGDLDPFERVEEVVVLLKAEYERLKELAWMYEDCCK